MKTSHNTKKPHISLVHDFFIMHGGAEKVFEAFLELPYEKEIFTSISYKKDYHGHPINQSFMAKFPFLQTFLTFYKLFLPFAFQSLKFNPETKLILSDTASFAKFIIPPPGVKHISYIHTPPRFLWNLDSSLKIRKNVFLSFLYNLFIGTWQRQADFIHAQRVHVLIANSKEVQDRIRKFYKRDAEIIHPPVDVREIIEKSAQFTQKIDEFLVFGRVEAYKGIEELLEIWPQDKKITIAGSGSLLPSLQKKYSGASHITFTGFVPESEKIKMLASYKAVIYPNREDFGIVMAESLAAGTPVIALAKGGALEIITHEKTGYLMPEVSAQNLLKALSWIEAESEDKLNSQNLQKSVLKFDKQYFVEKIAALVQQHI